MKTPEQIADELTNRDHPGPLPSLWTDQDVKEAIQVGVCAYEESYELADHVEAIKKYLAENELPDMTKVAFAADIRDILESLGVEDES